MKTRVHKDTEKPTGFNTTIKKDALLQTSKLGEIMSAIKIKRIIYNFSSSVELLTNHRLLLQVLPLVNLTARLETIKSP